MTKTERRAMRRQPGETWDAWLARFRLAQAQRYLQWADEALKEATTTIANTQPEARQTASRVHNGRENHQA